jgi:RNA polymerase sigma factor (sigma-70 family)
MATGQLNGVIRHLRRARLLRDGDGLTDGQLLERFVAGRDEVAFEVLVRRHGPLVLGVCRRVLGNVHDADDAFQATFLVLVRKAASLRSTGPLANWLYGVAYRTARKARQLTARRRVKEKPMQDLPEPRVQPEEVWQGLRPLLDQELQRLPDKYRVPVVLCDLEGKTRKEAARQLGWPEGTLSTRLMRARALLAKRLTRQGFSLSAGALAVVLSQQGSPACVPPPLLASTVQVARVMAAGQTAAAAVIPAEVATLTQGVLKSMFPTRLKLATAFLLAVGLVAAAAAGRVICQTQGVDEPNPPKDAQTTRAGQRGDQQPRDRPQKEKTPGASAPVAVEPKERATLKGHNRPVRSVAFTPDGQTLASGGGEGTVKLWDVATGKLRATLKGHTNTVQSVTITADGKTLASGSNDRTVRLWDLATLEERATLKGRPTLCFSVAFTPDGKTLASGTSNVSSGLEELHLWDVTDVTKAMIRAILKGQSSDLVSVVFTPDGKTLALGSGDGTVKLLDVTTGRERAAFRWHARSARVAFTADGKTLASASMDGTVKLWDMEANKERATLKGSSGFGSVAFTADGKLLACGCDDATIRLWDLATARERAALEGHTGQVLSVAFAPDGKTLASGSADGTAKLWDLAPGK